MRIVHASSDDIVKNWQSIKFAACAVNALSSEKRTALYCRNLLSQLLCAKVQAHLCVNEETRELIGIFLTTLRKDIGDIPHLLLDVVYGFIPTTMDEKKQMYDYFVKYARNTGCASVTAYTGNAMACNAARHMGLKATHTVFSAMV